MGRKILFDGQIKYKDSVKINSDSPAVNYGCGLFETILFENGKFFFFADHIERLKSACVELGIRLPGMNLISETRIRDLIFENNCMAKPQRIKIFYAPLTNPDGWNAVVSLSDYQRDDLKITAEVDTRIRDNFLSKYKTASYMRNYLSIAGRDKSEEILFVNSGIEITEGARTNIMCVKDASRYFTRTGENYLQGIMQKNIIKDHKKFGLKNIIELDGGFSFDFIKRSDEMILTGSLIVSKNISVMNFGKDTHKFYSFKLSEIINSFYLK
jgi:branched-subunit amino acid aminotransferase/4-amino-4-deoxychorismate lyase